MLIQPDRNELGDARVKDAEAVAKVKEENRNRANQNRVPDQDILEDKQAAMSGLSLEPSEVIIRLQKLNPKIVIQQGGVRNAVAVRYPKLVDGEMQLEYITGFYIDSPLPEFSFVVVDNRGLPWREVRGWRTVLSQLIRAKVITKKKADLMFGTANGQRAVLWDRQTSERKIA